MIDLLNLVCLLRLCEVVHLGDTFRGSLRRGRRINLLFLPGLQHDAAGRHLHVSLCLWKPLSLKPLRWLTLASDLSVSQQLGETILWTLANVDLIFNVLHLGGILNGLSS